MMRRVVKYGDLFDNKVKTQEKVLGLIKRSGIKPLLLVDEAYSVIEDVVGEKISNKHDQQYYLPVKQAQVNLFFVGNDLLKKIEDFGSVTCSYFDEGAGFSKDGDLIEYVTVTRNYIPVISAGFYTENTNHDEREKVESGGVYRKEECKSRIDFISYERSFVDLSGAFFTGLNSDREFDRLDDVPVLDDSIVFSVAGEELTPCLGEKNKYTCRPTARYRYKLCAYPDGFSGVQYIANSFIVPPPKKINISAQDLVFISGDADLLLKIYKSPVSVINGSDSSAPKDEADNPFGVERLKDLPDYSVARSEAIEWICKSAEIKKEDLVNAGKLIEYVAVAIMTWNSTGLGKRSNRARCKKLIRISELDPAYINQLERMIVLDFGVGRKTNVVRDSDRKRKSPELKKMTKNNHDLLKKTAISVLIDLWKLFVFAPDRSRNNLKKSRWKSDLRDGLEKRNIGNDYCSAVVSILLSDQDSERLFP